MKLSIITPYYKTLEYTKELNFDKAKTIIKNLDLSNKNIVIIEPK